MLFKSDLSQSESFWVWNTDYSMQVAIDLLDWDDDMKMYLQFLRCAIARSDDENAIVFE